MYIEELYNLIDIMDLNKNELTNIKKIIRSASYLYLSEMQKKQITETLKFDIEGCYINQSEFLSNLGISVYPKSWKQEHTDYSDPFGPSDSIHWTTTESKTTVIFPTRLFATDTKDDVLNRAKRKAL